MSNKMIVNGVEINKDLLKQDIDHKRTPQSEAEWSKWCNALYNNYDFSNMTKEQIEKLDEEFKNTIRELAEDKEEAKWLIKDCLE